MTTDYDVLLEKAKRKVPRRGDGGYDEDKLLAALYELITVNVDAEKKRIAKAIIDAKSKPGSTDPTGQLKLPGFDLLYDYEPERLVRDDSGGVVEQDKAPYSYKVAESRRAAKHAKEASQWADRKRQESELHAQWVIEQHENGRTKNLTFGDCVRDMNLFRPFDSVDAA